MAQETFSDRLRQAMSDRDVRQSDVIRASEMLGKKLGKSQMSQYVSGKTIPRRDVAELLARILEVDVTWLLAGDADQGEASSPRNDSKPEPHPSAQIARSTTMRTFSKSTKLDNVLYDVRGPVVDEAARMEDEGERILKLNIGNPAPFGFRTPDEVIKGMRQQLPDCEGYSNSRGLFSARKAIMQYSQIKGLPNVQMEHIYTGNGVSELIQLEDALALVHHTGGLVDDGAAHVIQDEGERILKLNIGNPAPFGFRTPDEVIKDMRQQLPDCEGYSNSRGLFSARKAIMQYSQIKGLPNVQMEHIYTGNGVSELIQLSMNALLDNGDEILIPSPDYPLWTACATLAGGHPVHYLCDEQADWYPDLEDMESKITSATKALVIINPNNPTGSVYPREVLEGIVEVARRHQLMIFADEIYDRLCMDGYEHVSIASLAPDLPCVTFSGLSKSHMIAGYRIGWMVLSGNQRCMSDFIMGINMLSNMRLCSNVPAQSIVQTALGGHQSVNDYIRPGGRVYEQRNFVYEALNKIDGISVVKPRAAFYIFPKMDVKKFNITDDEQFALDLLHEKKILITRGGGFNWAEPDHFRIVYLPRMEVLKESLEDLADFFDHYRQA